MNELSIPEIVIIDGKPTITSRQIAEDFEKVHHHVIRDIDAAEVSEKFRETNFGFSEYTVEGQSRKYKQYLLTRDGFTIIVMGYKGKRAMALKEAYIEAFNRMETELLSSTPTISAQQLHAIRDEMACVTRYMKHCSQSLSQNLYRRMKAELGYDKLEQLPPEQFEQVIRWLKPYQHVAKKVWDLTSSLEREFISRVKEYDNAPDDLLVAVDEKRLKLN